MRLFRPVGLEEMRLVYEADMRAFPPRLPDQPIFYPVTNEPYAIQIARDWNTKSGTGGGFVTRFSVADEYVSRFEKRVVGAKEHEELWVPAEDLAELNTRIEGRVDVTRAFFGDGYSGHLAPGSGAPDMTAREQLVALVRASRAGGADLHHEVTANHAAVFLNFFFWQSWDLTAHGLDAQARDDLLAALRGAWRHVHGDLELGTILEAS